MNSIKKRFVLSIMLLSGVFVANAQTDVFKINIFSPLVKTINFQYERKLSETSSFQLGLSYTTYSPSDTQFKGFTVTPEYRFYLSDTPAPAGVFIAPFLRYRNLEVSSGSDKGTFDAFGGGVIIGKQWIFKEHISMELFIGPSYSSGTTKVTQGSDNFSTGAFDGFGLRAGFCLGYAF